MGQNHFFHTDETLEFACVVKTICDDYDIHQDELVTLPATDHLIALTNKVRFKKRIPVHIPIPEELSPKRQKPRLRLYRERSIGDIEYHELTMDKLGIGLGEFELCGDKPIQFWAWNGEGDYYPPGSRQAYFLRQKNLRSFLRTLKHWEKQDLKDVDTPILPTEMLVEIFNNTVGFLLKGKDKKSQYSKYKIPYKRGILFCGRPGCGKTLTCKWLRELCSNKKLAYRIISMEDYREAVNRGRVRALFRLPKQQPGIIFFDDMDIMVKNRKESVNTHELSTFLSELDGLEPTEGVVYVFTTNYITELDEAFVRPGRIDLWLPFHPPSSKLRQKFIEEKFDQQILDTGTTSDLIERTKKYTFAEIEEIRKLFCMDLIDKKKLDVERTFKTFDKHRKEFAKRAEIQGFGSLQDDEDENDYSDADAVSGILDNMPWRD